MKSKIHVSVSGNGPAIVYLHGFLETHEIWNDFISSIGNYTHYAFDLPGFGRSELPSAEFTLEEIARIIKEETESLKLTGFHLVGHSLGGYIALSFLKLFPEKVRSITLFHSTTLPDSDEKKDNRTKTIQFIDENGVETFARNFVKPLFANPNHVIIPKIQELAVKSNPKTVIQYLAAMRDRYDNTSTLISSNKPAFLILGEKDTVINHQTLKSALGNGKNIEISTLPTVGHMGMFEETELTSELLVNFLDRI